MHMCGVVVDQLPNWTATRLLVDDQFVVPSLCSAGAVVHLEMRQCWSAGKDLASSLDIRHVVEVESCSAY